jgi:hypothetical protein
MQSEVDLMHEVQIKQKNLSDVIVDVGLHGPLWKVKLMFTAQSQFITFMHECLDDLENAKMPIKEEYEEE